MTEYNYELNGESEGPVTKAEIKEMLNNGTLNGDSRIWTKGWANWRQIKELSEFQISPPPLHRPQSTRGLDDKVIALQEARKNLTKRLIPIVLVLLIGVSAFWYFTSYKPVHEELISGGNFIEVLDLEMQVLGLRKFSVSGTFYSNAEHATYNQIVYTLDVEDISGSVVFSQLYTHNTVLRPSQFVEFKIVDKLPLKYAMSDLKYSVNVMRANPISH